MDRYNFIFSPRLPYWILRHLTFWVIFCVWYLQLCVGVRLNVDYYLNWLPYLYTRLPVSMIATYVTLYVLIPKYLLTRRYHRFFIAVALLGIGLPLLVTFNPLEHFAIADYDKITAPMKDGIWNVEDLRTFKVSMWDGLGLTLGVSSFASVLRLMTLYAIENSHNKRLQQQKVQQDLQLLKSQLNSRFVFTALQTIQENIDKQSPHSASLVLKFSDLLSYILYENDEAFVALNKEIEVIDAYLVLEKENHGDNVALTITKNGDFLGLQVVPLLLLPLVESCFEHSFIGEENVAINVDFSHDGVILLLRLNVRNLPQHGDRITQQSKTIKSVIQRLQSCYRDRHQIDIHTIDNNYELRLSLNLN